MANIKTNRVVNVYKFNNEDEFQTFVNKIGNTIYSGNIISVVGNQFGGDINYDNTSSGYDIYLGKESITKLIFALKDNTGNITLLNPSSDFTNGEQYLISGFSRTADASFHSKIVYLKKYEGDTSTNLINMTDDRYYDMFHYTHLVFRKLYSLLYKFNKPLINGIEFNISPGNYEIGDNIILSSVKISSFSNSVPTAAYIMKNNDVSLFEDTNVLSTLATLRNDVSNAISPNLSITNSITFFIGYVYPYKDIVNQIKDENNFDVSIDMNNIVDVSDGFSYADESYSYNFFYKQKYFWTPDNLSDTVNDISIGALMKNPAYGSDHEFSVCMNKTFAGNLEDWIDTSNTDGNFLYLILPDAYELPQYAVDGQLYNIEVKIKSAVYNGISYNLWRSTSAIEGRNIIIY